MTIKWYNEICGNLLCHISTKPKRITCAIDARRSYPGVVDGCSHHAVQDFCFFFSVIHLQQDKSDNWCKLWPEQPISSSYLNLLHPPEREQTVGLENRSTTISSAGLVFMSWKLVSMRDDFVWNCGGKFVTIQKRREGWRGGEDAEGGGGHPSWLVEHRKSPKNHSPTLKSSEEWHIGWWLGRRGRSQLRRATDSRAEEEGAAPPGKEDHPASDTSPASH